MPSDLHRCLGAPPPSERQNDFLGAVSRGNEARGGPTDPGLARRSVARRPRTVVLAAHRPLAPRTATTAVGVLVERAAVLAGAGGGGLLGCFAAIDDPRDRRGVRHSLPSILGLCAAAVTSGQELLADITAWISAAGQEV